MTMKRYAFPIALLAVCIGLGIYLYFSQQKGDELPVQGPGPEFSYQDADGGEVSLTGTNGKVRLLYFFFANCPDVCPPTTALLSKVQNELKADGDFGDKVQFYSVTIDPTNDTPEKLKEYASMFDADPKGWKFLRGDEKATAALAHDYGVLVEKDKDGNFGHMNLIVLIDQKGRIRDWISANDYTQMGEDNLKPEDMVKQIKSLL